MIWVSKQQLEDNGRASLGAVEKLCMVGLKQTTSRLLAVSDTMHLKHYILLAGIFIGLVLMITYRKHYIHCKSIPLWLTERKGTGKYFLASLDI